MGSGPSLSRKATTIIYINTRNTHIHFSFRFFFDVLFFDSQSVAQRSGASSMEMRARVCDLLGKEANRKARVVTFSHKRIHKVQQVNLQTKRFFSEDLDRNVKLRLSTKGIKTVNKMGGIDAAAKKFNVDLKKF